MPDHRTLLLAAGLCVAARDLPAQGLFERRIERRTNSCAIRTACVYGTVVDSSGVAVGGAWVSIGGTPAAAFADNGGRFALGVAPGLYRISVRAVGYSTASDSVRLTEDSTVHLRVRLGVSAAACENCELRPAAPAQPTPQVGPPQPKQPALPKPQPGTR